MSVISRMGQSRTQQVDGAWWPKTSIPYHMDPFDHPCVLTTWQLASSRASDQERSRWKLQHFLWLSPRSYSPSFLQHPMGCTGQTCSLWERITQGMSVRKRESLGSTWKWSLQCSQAFRWCNPGWHLHCSLLRHGAPEPSIYTGPDFLIHRNTEIINALVF